MCLRKGRRWRESWTRGRVQLLSRYKLRMNERKRWRIDKPTTTSNHDTRTDWQQDVRIRRVVAMATGKLQQNGHSLNFGLVLQMRMLRDGRWWTNGRVLIVNFPTRCHGDQVYHLVDFRSRLARLLITARTQKNSWISRKTGATFSKQSSASHPFHRQNIPQPMDRVRYERWAWLNTVPLFPCNSLVCQRISMK